MYNGVLLILVGEAWVFASLALLTYAAVVFIAFHLFVVLYEEPALEARFRDSYVAYRRSAPRWVLRLMPTTPERSISALRRQTGCLDMTDTSLLSLPLRQAPACLRPGDHVITM